MWWFVCVVFGVVFIFNTCLFSYIPVGRKEQAYFGVRVAPEFYQSAEGRGYYSRFLTCFLPVTAVPFGICVLLLFAAPLWGMVVAQMVLVGQLVWFMVLYVRFHKAVSPFEQERVPNRRGRVSVSIRPRLSREYVYPAWESPALLLLSMMLGVTGYLYPHLPEIIHTVYHLAGAEVPIGRASIWTIPLLAMFYYAAVTIFQRFIPLVKLNYPSRQTEEYEDLVHKRMVLNSKAAAVTKAVLMLIFIVLQINKLMEHLGIAGSGLWFGLSMGLLWIGGITAFIIYYLKHQHIQEQIEKICTSDHPDPQLQESNYRMWYFGYVYYNPDDPSIFVERRRGAGVDLNYAQPISWAYIAGMVTIFPTLFLSLRVFV
ncbi:putative membrane protein [Caldalkalibacillus uzonensis]|uniref:Membrane protein n=1 Tax=Caldalkalibacillus uzonensis TaxID=353224 RepID=A0ABU0CWZ5_9BACI|nr:DUF5808 domain-containing protein [Caldalkalibacillus uzonensis]MDQ0340662.1 putative membrane protein [Caldalkalibacillus uzonensis]